MKVSEISIKGFKRFTDLVINDIYIKKGDEVEKIQDAISIKFHDLREYNENTIKGKFYF